jgi:hypothetical protein
MKEASQPKGDFSMATVLGVLALVTLSLSFATAFTAIWTHSDTKEIFAFINILISWKVLGGGLAIGAARTFHKEIASFLTRSAKQTT